MHFPDWIPRVVEDYEEEVSRDKGWPIKLLDKLGRVKVWDLCAVIGVNANGVPAMACLLLERYLAAQTRVYSKLPKGSQEWTMLKKWLSSRLPLLTISCIQLAAKMSCSSIRMSTRVLRACLLIRGIQYTVKEIAESEFHVFKMLDFRLPMWTSVDTAQALAIELGMNNDELVGVELFVNLAEFRRDVIDQKLRWLVQNSLTVEDSPGAMGKLRSLHLAAGCVVAAALYLKHPGGDPAEHLARLLSAPPSFIHSVGTIILTTVIAQDLKERVTPEKKDLKRKLDNSCKCASKRRI